MSASARALAAATRWLDTRGIRWTWVTPALRQAATAAASTATDRSSGPTEGEHGHVQRLGPAVLATWDPNLDRFEHFGWGVTPELAMRVGHKPGDFELEVDRRCDYLAGRAEAGIVDIDAVRVAIEAYRHNAATMHPTPITT